MRMRKLDARSIVGILLVLLGLLLLLQNLQVLPIPWDLFWAGLFLAAGLAFIALFIEQPRMWWALIPGFFLIAGGIQIALQFVAPWVAGDWGGTVFLAVLGLSFCAIYLVRRDYWWSIIPGGVLFTLAMVASVSRTTHSGAQSGGIFFLGLALTFALLYLLVEPRGRMTWALIPATILMILGLITMAATSPLINYLWPLLLVFIGAYLVYQATQARQR